MDIVEVYNMNAESQHMARVTLLRSALKPGDTLAATIEFNEDSGVAPLQVRGGSFGQVPVPCERHTDTHTRTHTHTAHSTL